MLNIKCLNCHSGDVIIRLDFGAQPPSNRFLSLERADSQRHPLVMGQCEACGLWQLLNPMPAEMVRPHHNWLQYNEPESHLDDLVNKLSHVITPDARIIGLSYKDDSTLARFNKLGFTNTARFDLTQDLGIQDACAGLETLQAVFNDTLANELIKCYGQADLLIARHVLEHAHNPTSFLHALTRLLTKNGNLVLEVPDCRKFVKACDYSFVWEEHISYFSPRTLTNFLSHNAYEIIRLEIYSYTLEDSLIAVAQAGNSNAALFQSESLIDELTTGQHFANHFMTYKQSLRRYLKNLHDEGQRLAVFGAGHLAAKFINFFELANLLKFVIDDNPHKQGLAMPGSSLPIVGTERLPEIDLCLLSLNPESEQKVLNKQQTFVEAGGRFASIFPLSPRALKLA